MAQFVVRNLEEGVKLRLQRRARLHQTNLEDEVRTILRNAVKEPSRKSEGLGTRIAKRFVGIGLTEPIPEMRGEEPRPAIFDE